MGISGTGVVAGVAQAGLQAQQLGRQQARQASDRAYVQQRQKEVRETRRKRLEEDDGAEAETDLHLDGELLERDGHADPQAAPEHRHPHEQPDPEAAGAAVEGEASEGPAVTYHPPAQANATPAPAARHRLDVQA